MQYVPILYETTVFTFYRALAGASVFEHADPAEQTAIAATLGEAIADFTLWTTNCPDNFAWQEQLLRAEQARISRRPAECEAAIRYVIRTLQDLTLDDARQDPAFCRDPYVQRHGVRSVFCLPLLAQLACRRHSDRTFDLMSKALQPRTQSTIRGGMAQ